MAGLDGTARAAKSRLDPRGVFYGWWIVATSIGVQMLIGGLALQTSGAYVVALGDDLAWSRTMLSTGFAFISIGMVGGLGPLQGWLVDRFGPRRVMRTGIVVLSLSFVGFSQVEHPVAFFAAMICISVGASLAGFLSLTIAVVNWFEARRSTALGLMQTGFPIGSALVPLVAWSITSYGWRPAALVSGIVILLVTWPLAGLIRDRPEPYGYGPDGRPIDQEPPRSTGEGSTVSTPAPEGYTLRQAVRLPAFWYISLGHATALLVVSAVMVHLIAHLNEAMGYSVEHAATWVVVVAVVQGIAQVGGGFMGDRISKRVIITLCMVGHLVGMLLLAFATAFWMVAAFALIHGAAWGMRGPLLVAIRADYFGRASFGTILGLSSIVSLAGMISGPIVAATLYDTTGSYTAGFTVLAIVAGLGGFLFALARPPRQPTGAL